MKKLILNIKNGEISLIETPVPKIGEGEVLIKTELSMISLGTEKMLINFGKSNYFKKALQQPHRVKQVINKISTDGIFPTIESIKNKLDEPISLGYCNFGKVIESKSAEFSVGDNVISNGSHAEFVVSPTNLIAKVPKNVDGKEAVFTVLASIGLQGIRLAKPTLGENVVVYGLGLIGLLTCQILIANGCNVIGVDVDNEKCELGKNLGIKVINGTDAEILINEVQQVTMGHGADSVIITAKTDKNNVIKNSANISKKKGKVVLIGEVGLNLDRSDFYEKEISFQVSSSYGPGRYDPSYERDNIDYPYPYVRWTAKRNFEAILQLFKKKKISVEDLISSSFEFENILEAYKNINNSSSLGVLINYNKNYQNYENLNKLNLSSKNLNNDNKKIVLGIIGTGAYANKFLLPYIDRNKTSFKTAVSQTGLSATLTAKKFNFSVSSSDPNDIIDDDDINTVFISTRHDSHAKYVIDCLKKDKIVFVEKPLALTHKDIDLISEACENNSKLMIGFNRRFSSLVQKAKSILKESDTPISLNYNINSGFLDNTHWTLNKKIGGGRIIGEVCHFLDLTIFLIGSSIKNWNILKVDSLEGCLTVQIKFLNDSIATINYFSNGNKAYSKEIIEIFNNGRIMKLDNFNKLQFYGYKEKNISLWKQDKGQEKCIQSFIDSIISNNPSPIPINEILEVSRTVIDFDEKN